MTGNVRNVQRARLPCTISAECMRNVKRSGCTHVTLYAFEPFYTRLIIENRLLPPGARDSFIAIQSAISFHFSRAVQRERKSAQNDEIPSYLLFNMWVGLVYYYLANGDLFAPEGHVIRRYGETLIQSFLKLLTTKGEKQNG